MAIAEIPDCHDMFEMTAEGWSELLDEERLEIIRTLSDDIFYGLGSIRQLHVGSGQIEYDPSNHVIKVTSGTQVVHIIRLI